ncbi:ABC transporter ATP-binding protein [Stackebrandtia nassauensis]
MDGARLRAVDVTVGYDGKIVSRDLSMSVPDGGFTVIVGPNACGKSTLLRALARLLRPKSGEVVLDGRAITQYGSREVARRLGLLPQSSAIPESITVADLVARGRYPHQGLLRQWTPADEAAVREALAATSLTELGAWQVDRLSGGQQQRAWVAMVLAQRTELVLLDEPTTYLDIAHQVELLDLFNRLHQRGHTIVAVLHDLNQAARYATHLVAMRDGAIVAQGPPSEVVSAELVEEVFGLPCVVVPDPVTGTPAVFPRSRP